MLVIFVARFLNGAQFQFIDMRIITLACPPSGKIYQFCDMRVEARIQFHAIARIRTPDATSETDTNLLSAFITKLLVFTGFKAG